MGSGVQARFPNESNFLKGICSIGRWETEYLCREWNTCKANKVESIACSENSREVRMGGGSVYGEKERRARPRRTLDFFLVMENGWKIYNASIGIFRTNNQCTHKYIIQNDKPEPVPSLGRVSERFLTVSNKGKCFVNVPALCSSFSLAFL